MRARNRYGLIAAGFVAFIVLSPFIVLFVTGTKYDFEARRFVKTGAISAYTEPKNASIFLNDKGYGRTNRVIRFLESGNYKVELKKEGYMTWSKNLFVRDQYVTWAHQDLENVTMFFEQPDTLHVSKDVSTFYASDKKIVFTTQDSIFGADTGSPLRTRDVNIGVTFQNPQILASPDESLFLITDNEFAGVYDFNRNVFSDVSALIRTNPNSYFEFGPGNDIYTLEQNILYRIDWRKNIKEPMVLGVVGFHITGQSLYIIRNDSITTTLALIQLPSLEQSVLLLDFPVFSKANIYISDRNQIFILADNSLYALGNGLYKIADLVTFVEVDNNAKKLLFSSNNEISSYNFLNNSTSLITRSTRAIAHPSSALRFGWVFFINDGRLQSIEADTRGGQNNYTFAQVSDSAKYFVDKDAKRILLLDGGTLKSLKIR